MDQQKSDTAGEARDINPVCPGEGIGETPRIDYTVRKLTVPVRIRPAGVRNEAADKAAAIVAKVRSLLNCARLEEGRYAGVVGRRQGAIKRTWQNNVINKASGILGMGLRNIEEYNNQDRLRIIQKIRKTIGEIFAQDDLNRLLPNFMRQE